MFYKYGNLWGVDFGGYLVFHKQNNHIIFKILSKKLMNNENIVLIK